MLLLLVVTAAVSLLPGATSQSEQFFALTECPINYYGESYTEAYGFINEEVFTLVFGDVTGSDFMTFVFEDLVEVVAFAPTFIVADETSEFVKNLPDLVGTSPCFYDPFTFPHIWSSRSIPRHLACASGQFYPPGTETCASETLFVTCNSTAFLTVSEEDPRCLRKSVCTITVMWRPIDNPSNDVQ
ncbi:uncharacterized protein LOC133487092 isoform X2 [Phyllopteryx taeniolatus]|uniref:uncharacterized protein LOC133487092 isoform X2 n=1 Tax=Phyllopteryx taeniolatus TaxID=161469 RepID=UPI002AD3BDC3|nr:uncharacterized protein LOC133487092 isoform X2 [Phyllopteryx taeniolatus]